MLKYRIRLSAAFIVNHSDSEGNKKKDRIPAIRLGLKANINQFLLLVLVNAFVGAMIGLEQTVVPLLGKEVFGLESNVLILSFIASFDIISCSPRDKGFNITKYPSDTP
jgi:hypothetical protein